MQTFKQFETELLEEARKWLINWVEKNAAAPDEYPMEMLNEEWWEQFISSFYDQ
tara:strand:+ start:163 stop:324 length:162 start_codon:yes stop_codon:yes gene_type:complete